MKDSGDAVVAWLASRNGARLDVSHFEHEPGKHRWCAEVLLAIEVDDDGGGIDETVCSASGPTLEAALAAVGAALQGIK